MLTGFRLDNGKTKAFPLELIRKTPGTVENHLGDAVIRIKVNEEGQVSGVFDNKGTTIPHMFVYWFAWQAFHPETEVYRR